MRIRGQRIQQLIAKIERKLPKEVEDKSRKMGKNVELQKHRIETAAAVKHWEQVNDAFEESSKNFP